MDAALQAENATREKRRYLGGSRLGVASNARCIRICRCPGGSGSEFPGRTLRIFEVGHALEDLAIRWLRLAGFDLYTRRKDGGSSVFPLRTAVFRVTSMA